MLKGMARRGRAVRPVVHAVVVVVVCGGEGRLERAVFKGLVGSGLRGRLGIEGPADNGELSKITEPASDARSDCLQWVRDNVAQGKLCRLFGFRFVGARLVGMLWGEKSM